MAKKYATPEEINQANKDGASSEHIKEQAQLQAGIAKAAEKDGFRAAPLDYMNKATSSIAKPSSAEHMSNDTWDTYKDEGINFSASSNWDFERAKNQSWQSQLGGMANQAIVGEVIGGSIEGVGLLASILNPFNDMSDVLDGTAENFMTSIGRSMGEWAQETTPIYQTEPGEFNPSDPGWWFSGAVSTASFASMLIPASGVARVAGGLSKTLGLTNKFLKGTSAIGRIGKEGSKLNKFMQLAEKGVKELPELALKSYVSRKLESTMEAQGIFQEQQDKYIQAGFEYNDASKLAGIAAATTYNKNMELFI